jgi:hypothetical protein
MMNGFQVLHLFFNLRPYYEYISQGSPNLAEKESTTFRHSTVGWCRLYLSPLN